MRLIPVVDNDKLIAASKDELQLVLSFFPRVESKFSVILAIDTGMIGFLAANASSVQGILDMDAVIERRHGFTSRRKPCLAVSGKLTEPERRRIFACLFQGNSKAQEAPFHETFSAQTEKQYGHDLLAQVWRENRRY